MPHVQINGTELFYRSVGTGWPCFILHGGLGLDHTFLHPWLDPLGDQLQLIYYDQRGNGRSGRPPLATLTFEQFCADLEALRIHLHVDRIALLGHSYGGFIALEYALRYPERVSHLILVDTVAALNFDADIQANLQRINPPQEILSALAAEPATDAEFQQVLQTITPLYFHTFDAAREQAAFQHVVWSAAAGSRGFEILDDIIMLHLGKIAQRLGLGLGAAAQVMIELVALVGDLLLEQRVKHNRRRAGSLQPARRIELFGQRRG